MKNRIASLMLAASAFAGSAMGQSYPGKPITVYSNSGAGVQEAVQRAIFERIKETTGATLVLEMRAGAGGALTLQSVKRAAPDGHTIGIAFASSLTLLPVISPEIDIDPIKDFEPVTNIMDLPIVVVARADFQANDIHQLIALAKSKPGAVPFGIVGAGNRSWLAMINDRTGAEFLQVPFKSSSESITRALGGHIDVFFGTVASVTTQGGKLKALAIGDGRPVPSMTGVPQIGEIVPGMTMTTWFAAIAPAKTPPAALTWLEQELIKATRHPPIVKLIESGGFSVVANSSAQFRKSMTGEIQAMRAVVRKFNITAN